MGETDREMMSRWSEGKKRSQTTWEWTADPNAEETKADRQASFGEVRERT